MLPITANLLTSTKNRPYLRNKNIYYIRQLKGVIAHWTANTNKGADAKANRNYFNNVANYASAHYIVDDKSIIQCIPDNEVGYHVGANKYKDDGELIRDGSSLSPNYFVIGFEMCVNSDGDWSKTYQHSVDLAAHLLHKYRFSLNDLFRHHDITGKDCPKMMLTDETWGKFKADVALAMQKIPLPPLYQASVTASELNVRKGPGTSFGIIEKLKKGDKIYVLAENNGWARIGDNRWVSMSFLEKTFQSRWAQIISPSGTEVFAGPGQQHAVVDALPVGALVTVISENGSWAEVHPGRWIRQSARDWLTVKEGVVTGSNMLNVRFGPDTKYPVVKKLLKGDKVVYYNKSERWLQIGPNAWVFDAFVK